MNSLTHGKAKGGLYCANKRTRNKLVAKHIHKNVKMLYLTILLWMVRGRGHLANDTSYHLNHHNKDTKHMKASLVLYRVPFPLVLTAALWRSSSLLEQLLCWDLISPIHFSLELVTALGIGMGAGRWRY